MRILQVIDFFKPFWSAGGITPVCYFISRELVNRGHEVTVYSNGDGRESTSEVIKNIPQTMDGMVVYYFKNISSRLAKENFYTPYLLPGIAKKCIRNFDIIHIHTFRSTLAIPIWYYAKKHSIPYVLQAHGSLPYMNQKEYFKKIFDSIVGDKILKDASKVIALNSTEAAQYKKMDVAENNIEIIPNGIDLSEYEKLPDRGRFRTKYQIKDNEKIILYLGRIHKRKGIDLLINAYSKLVKDMKKARLIIVGPDDMYLSELKKQITELGIEDKVIFTGPLFNHDKLSAYLDADVLVYPAIYEIFGLVPFEAIISGTPIIVTDDCGCGEIVKEAECGYLVRYGDIEGLKNQILYVLNNPDEAKKKVLQGQKYIYNNLTWDKIVMKVEDVYEDLIRNV